MSAARLHVALDGSLTMRMLQEDMTRLIRDITACSLEPIAVLKLARARGLPWSHDMPLYAAFYNKLELLQWLRSVNCPWKVNAVIQNAPIKGGTELLEWLQSQVGRELLATHARFMTQNAENHGNFEAVQWIEHMAKAAYNSRVTLQQQ
jgi:hypothetical protein